MKITIEGLDKIRGKVDDWYSLLEVREWDGAYEFIWDVGGSLHKVLIHREFDDWISSGDYSLSLKLDGEWVSLHHITYLDLLKGAECFRTEMYHLLVSEFGREGDRRLFFVTL